MSASFASITKVADPPPLRADHGEFPLSADKPSVRTLLESVPFIRASDNESTHADPGREKGRLKLLMELTGEAVPNQELSNLVKAMMQSITSAIDADGVYIFLQSPKGGQLEAHALDFPTRARNFRESTAPLADTIARQVFQTGKTWIGTGEQACAAFSNHLLFAERFSEGCMLPLSGRNRIVGTLGLFRAECHRPYSTDEIDFLTHVSCQIALTIENALAYREISQLKDKLAHEKLYPEKEIRGEMNFEQIIGQSPALRQVLELVETVAPTDSTVLLLGETGTGKELIARAIHDHGRRKDRTFVKLNCAAIPTGLFESELFGHEKGAFTGAIGPKVGRIELADQGTLFLDEVGDVPLEIQPKLLRVLQEREFERLGSTRTKKVNVRLVAATNCDLEEKMADREFRCDLYYRLNVFPIRIPPLRERREDIGLLVSYFVQKYAGQMQKRIETIPTATMNALIEWEWPGNIRELQNFIERAVILSRGRVLEAPLGQLRKVQVDKPREAVGSEGPAELTRIVKETIEALSGKTSVVGVRERERKQREAIERALTESKGQVGGSDGAAAIMGINRTTLHSRMKKLGIDPKVFS